MYQICTYHTWKKVEKYTETFKELPQDCKMSDMFLLSYFCCKKQKKHIFYTEHKYCILIYFYTQCWCGPDNLFRGNLLSNIIYVHKSAQIVSIQLSGFFTK